MGGRDPALPRIAARINEATRLRALKIGFLALGALSLLAIVPARRLPAYRPGEAGGEGPEGLIRRASESF